MCPTSGTLRPLKLSASHPSGELIIDRDDGDHIGRLLAASTTTTALQQLIPPPMAAPRLRSPATACPRLFALRAPSPRACFSFSLS